MSTVLLVADDPDTCNLLAARVRLMGHRVLSAGSALETLDLMDEHAPDIAVLDLERDHDGGLELLDNLRRNDPAYAQLPAVLITNWHRGTGLDEAAVTNALLMNKPIERAGLSAAIEQVLHSTGF